MTKVVRMVSIVSFFFIMFCICNFFGPCQRVRNTVETILSLDDPELEDCIYSDLFPWIPVMKDEEITVPLQSQYEDRLNPILQSKVIQEKVDISAWIFIEEGRNVGIPR